MNGPDNRKTAGARRLAAGMCSTCGLTPPAPNRKSCADCLSKDAKRHEMRRRNSDKDRAMARRLREKSANAGLCGRCHKQPAEDGYAHCESCRARQRAYEKKNRRSPAGRALQARRLEVKAGADEERRAPEPAPPCCDYCGTHENPALRHWTKDCKRARGWMRGAALPERVYNECAAQES